MKFQKQEPDTDKKAIDLFTSIFNGFSGPASSGVYITRAEQGEKEGEIILKSEESPNLFGDRSNLPHSYYPSANTSLSNLADAADMDVDTSTGEGTGRTVTISSGATTGVASVPLSNLSWPSSATSVSMSTSRLTSTSRPVSTFYELDTEHNTLRKIREIYDSWYPDDPCSFDEVTMKELPKKILKDFCESLANDIQANKLTSAKQVINYLGKKGLFK